jgi:hypothetical protein
MVPFFPRPVLTTAHPRLMGHLRAGQQFCLGSSSQEGNDNILEAAEAGKTMAQSALPQPLSALPAASPEGSATSHTTMAHAPAAQTAGSP